MSGTRLGIRASKVTKTHHNSFMFKSGFVVSIRRSLSIYTGPFKALALAVCSHGHIFCRVCKINLF